MYMKNNNIIETYAVYDEASSQYVKYNVFIELSKFPDATRNIKVLRPFSAEYARTTESGIEYLYGFRDKVGSPNVVNLHSSRNLDPYFFGDLLWGEHSIAKTPENLMLLQEIINKHQEYTVYNAMYDEISTVFAIN